MDSATIVAAALVLVTVLVIAAFHRLEKHERKQLARQAERRSMFLLEVMEQEIGKHHDALDRRLRQLAWKDPYGNWVTAKWRKELDYFFDTNVFPTLDSAAPHEIQNLREMFYSEYLGLSQLGLNLFMGEEGQARPPVNNGLAFERQIGAILAGLGYSVTFTPASGDQGVDLIAERGGVRLAIQCKDYRAPAGNDAVQQAYAGAAFYNAARAVVVAPNGFTTAAKQLAASLGVECLHPSEVAMLATAPETGSQAAE